jgi:hypothetical protein
LGGSETLGSRVGGGEFDARIKIEEMECGRLTFFSLCRLRESEGVIFRFRMEVEALISNSLIAMSLNNTISIRLCCFYVYDTSNNLVSRACSTQSYEMDNV